MGQSRVLTREGASVTGRVNVSDLKELLKQVPLFQNAPERALEISASAVRKRVYEPGTTIFQEGDKGEALYILAQGLVKLSKVDLGGHEKTLDPAAARVLRRDGAGRRE